MKLAHCEVDMKLERVIVKFCTEKQELIQMCEKHWKQHEWNIHVYAGTDRVMENQESI